MPSSSPSLRERQAAATRQLIVDAALQLTLAGPAEPVTHERVAELAGLGVRTTYRHYPTRTDLIQALWERIRTETKTQFPSTEAEVVAFARTQFGEFDRHETIVRASLSFSAATELGARGSLEGRPAFRKSLTDITARLSPIEQRRLIALCLAIYSAPFWKLLRDRGELTGDEPGNAAAWALETLLDAARRDGAPVTSSTSNGTPNTRRSSKAAATSKATEATNRKNNAAKTRAPSSPTKRKST